MVDDVRFLRPQLNRFASPAAESLGRSFSNVIAMFAPRDPVAEQREALALQTQRSNLETMRLTNEAKRLERDTRAEILNRFPVGNETRVDFSMTPQQAADAGGAVRQLIPINDLSTEAGRRAETLGLALRSNLAGLGNTDDLTRTFGVTMPSMVGGTPVGEEERRRFFATTGNPTSNTALTGARVDELTAREQANALQLQRQRDAAALQRTRVTQAGASARNNASIQAADRRAASRLELDRQKAEQKAAVESQERLDIPPGQIAAFTTARSGLRSGQSLLDELDAEGFSAFDRFRASSVESLTGKRDEFKRKMNNLIEGVVRKRTGAGQSETEVRESMAQNTIGVLDDEQSAREKITRLMAELNDVVVTLDPDGSRGRFLDEQQPFNSNQPAQQAPAQAAAPIPENLVPAGTNARGQAIFRDPATGALFVDE